MSLKTLFEYKGQGKIILDNGIDFETEFSIITKHNGDASLYSKSFLTEKNVIILKEEIESNSPIHAKFFGQENRTKAEISINDLYLNSLELVAEKGKFIILELDFIIVSDIIVKYHHLSEDDVVTIDFGLTNFLFNGCEWSEIGNRRVRDKFQVKINGFDVLFRQDTNYEEIAKKIKRNKCIAVCSHAIIITTVDRIEKLDETLQDAITLLSFASGSYIATVYRNIYKNNELFQTQFRPCRTLPYNPSDPVIDIKNLEECKVKTFLKITFPKYRALKKELGLEKVIDYYLYSKLLSILQIKYLLAVIAFECLTSYLPNYFKAHQKKADLSSFKKKVKSCFDEFRITYDECELRFVNIRDKIVHTGDFPLNTNELHEYACLINLLDRTILTILGYKGHKYLNKAKRYSEEILN